MAAEYGPVPGSVTPEARTPEANSGLTAELKPAVVITPIRDQDHLDFKPFNPRTVDCESFKGVPGEIQEFALLYLLRKEEVEQVARLRPDFEMHAPISDYEARLSNAIDQITKREEPIQPTVGDGLFNFIKTFVSKALPKNIDGSGYRSFRQKEEEDLAGKLETERQRRQENPGILFYSHEDIGTYHPARRYRWLLEREVERQIGNERIASQRAGEDAVAEREVSRVAEIRPELRLILQDQKAA